MDEQQRTSNDPDGNKGAVEQNSPDDATNVAFEGQLPHRTENAFIKSSDSDYPEPGENPEHTGEPEVGSTAPKPDRAA